MYIKTAMPGSPINIDSADMINANTKVGVSVKSDTFFGCNAPAVLFDCVAAKVTDNILLSPASIEVNGGVRAAFVTSLSGFIGGKSEHVGVPQRS